MLFWSWPVIVEWPPQQLSRQTDRQQVEFGLDVDVKVEEPETEAMTTTTTTTTTTTGSLTIDLRCSF